MSRKFRTANYEETLNQTIRLAEALPPQHLARFVVDHAEPGFIIAQLDLSPIYSWYAPVGGEAIAPEILLGLLLYGYATGLFSSRKIEKATCESIPFRFIAGGLHPDHDTIANFRKTFLDEIQELFVQILLLAQAAGVLKLGNISLDGEIIYLNGPITISVGLTIDGNNLENHIKVNGEGSGKSFIVEGRITVYIDFIDFVDGNSNTDGGAINNNLGAITITMSTFNDNYVAQSGGAIFSNVGNATIRNSTFSGDSTGGISGGVFAFQGNMAISTSTLSGHSTHDYGR